MCHPFHQILPAQSRAGDSAQESFSGDHLLPEVQSRRTWFGSLIAAGAAAMALFKASSYATAQVSSSVAAPGKVTTQALGEEGSGYPPPSYPPPSYPAPNYPSPSYPPSNFPSPSYPSPSYPSPSYPSPSYPSPSYPSPSYPSPSYPSGPVTTQALGEEGAGYPKPPYRYRRGQPTTYALGEEGSRYYRLPSDDYRPRSSPPPGTVTTFALGEEGGTYRP